MDAVLSPSPVMCSRFLKVVINYYGHYLYIIRRGMRIIFLGPMRRPVASSPPALLPVRGMAIGHVLAIWQQASLLFQRLNLRTKSEHTFVATVARAWRVLNR